MTELEYEDAYPYRSLALHTGAYLKDRLLPFTVLLGGMGGDGKPTGRAAETPIGKASQGARPTSLYRWFRRHPGRVYTVVSNEDDLRALKGAQRAWTQGMG